jgi:hypothetical protein
MTDVMTRLAALRRPRLLIRAARIGLADYNRDRDLKRLTRCATPPSPQVAFDRLIDEETRMDEGRRTGQAGYCAIRHVDVLIALIAEARLIPHVVARATPPSGA